MSTHTFADPGIGKLEMLAAIGTALRPADGLTVNADGTLTLTFTPDLTADEVTTLMALVGDLADLARTGSGLTLAEWRARKADVQGLRDYMALASPTAAQTQAAFKALVRVTAAMLRVQIG